MKLSSVFLALIFPFYLLSASPTSDDIQKGAVYRMRILTNDIIEGTVEYKDDTTIIIESIEDNKPFTFRLTLIESYEMLSGPPVMVGADSIDTSLENGEKSKAYTWEALRVNGPASGKISVHITNGSVYVGKVSSISDSELKLSVEGSLIPITRNVVRAIFEYNENKKDTTAQSTVSVPKIQDTIFVKNPKEHISTPIIIAGTITSDNAKAVTIETPGGLKRAIKRDKIERIIRNSIPSEQEEIVRYAKTLFCDNDMILIDIPPGKDGRPFFKACIDKYEFPNKENVMPLGNISYEKAQQLCEEKGKRLCTVDEWQWACGGLEGYTYPYGWNFEEKTCNAEGIQSIGKSGAFDKCYSKFGVYDMVGNIFEWVRGTNGEPMLMGGPFSKCQTVSPGVHGNPKPQIGFRCCTSN